MNSRPFSLYLYDVTAGALSWPHYHASYATLERAQEVARSRVAKGLYDHRVARIIERGHALNIVAGRLVAEGYEDHRIPESWKSNGHHYEVVKKGTNE